MLRVSSLGLDPRLPTRHTRCSPFTGVQNTARRILAVNAIIYQTFASLNSASRSDRKLQTSKGQGGQEKLSSNTGKNVKFIRSTNRKGDRGRRHAACLFGETGSESDESILNPSFLSSSGKPIKHATFRMPLQGLSVSARLADDPNGNIQREGLPEHVPIQKGFHYPVGRPWHTIPIPPLWIKRSGGYRAPHTLPAVGNPITSISNKSKTAAPNVKDDQDRRGKFENGDERPSSVGGFRDSILRRSLLHILGSTSSATKAWETYTTLLTIPPPDGWPPHKPWTKIPLTHLHRLCRILSRNRPKTRAQFLRLLSVLRTIQQSGGQIHLHEWNAAIDHAGKGWRKTTPDDFKLALGVFHDMIEQRPPGSSLSENEFGTGIKDSKPVLPDVVTYTTLLSIAARTLHGPTVRYASSLLQSSGIPPNRITHLSLLKYFTLTKSLSGVRSTLLKMKQQGMDLGLDGINACLWAYGHSHRVDIVMMIYRVLRHNVFPETCAGEDDVSSTARRLQEDEDIVIPKNVKPSEVTFTIVIQTLAYHGDLAATSSVFMDMLSSNNLEAGARLHRDEKRKLRPSTYSPTFSVFRAIFLGFSRHGISPVEKEHHDRSPNSQFINGSHTAWSLESLTALFHSFLTLPGYIKPGKSIISWIMVAFDRTSGHDVDMLRQVWTQLENRFGGSWGGPGCRLWRLKAKLFSPESKYQPPNAKLL